MPGPKPELMKQSQLILTHIPRTGGVSLHMFFRRLFGNAKIYKYRSRHLDQTSNVLAQLGEEERDKYRLFQGHFRFGEHRSLSKPCLYVGLIRHPVDRMISLYQFNRESGRPVVKERLSELSIEGFIDEKIASSKEGIFTAQMFWLTGKRNLAAACEVIKNRYLMCAATDQVDRMQQALAQLYDKPELEPVHLNVSGSDGPSEAERAALMERYEQRFETEIAFLKFVRRRFHRVYANMTPEEMVALIEALPAPAAGKGPKAKGPGAQKAQGGGPNKAAAALAAGGAAGEAGAGPKGPGAALKKKMGPAKAGGGAGKQKPALAVVAGVGEEKGIATPLKKFSPEKEVEAPAATESDSPLLATPSPVAKGPGPGKGRAGGAKRPGAGPNKQDGGPGRPKKGPGGGQGGGAGRAKTKAG